MANGGGGGCGNGCGLCWGHDVFHGIVNEVSNVPILTAQRSTIIDTRGLKVHKHKVWEYIHLYNTYNIISVRSTCMWLLETCIQILRE